MSLPMRMKTTTLLVLVLFILACAAQAFAQTLPGIGTVNGLAVDVVKVTTNPTDPKDTVDRSGPVGGSSVSVYVKVQYGNMITNINSVTVNIHEYGVGTSAGSLSLTSFTQLSDSGSGDATVHTRVYTGTWNTLTTTPLIYNANYCFKATVDYDRNSSHASPAVDSDEVSVPVKNLIIKTVTPEDFTVVTAGQSTPVNFGITLEDYASTLSYTLTLTIRYTSNDSSVIRTITQTGTGLSHTISWDLKNDSGASIAASGGYFTYDLTVSHGTDTQRYRSSHLSITNDDINFETDTDGNTIRNSSGQVHALFKYLLSEQPYSGSVAVYFYQDTTPQGSVTGLSDQDRWNAPNSPVDIWLALGENLSARGIICAKDNRSAEYRDKQPKRMLVKNNGRAHYWRRCALTFNLVGAGNEPGYLREWAKFWDNDTMTIAKDWHVENSWPGNTSSGTRMNADDHDLEWETGGPLPESSPTDNTVYENETNLRWHISNGDGIIITNTSSRTGFTWCNADGSLKDFGGATPYREWRYYILNDSDGDTHHPVWDPTHHERSLFRIHEDGNYNTSKGSAGCIALLPGEMEKFWNRSNQIGGALTAWDGDMWLPLMVYDRNGCGGVLTRMNSWGTSKLCNH